MLSGRRFHFRPILTFFMLAGLAVLIGLGSWQLKRLEWKRDLIAKVEERISSPPIPFDEALARAQEGDDMEYTPVIAQGVYAHDLETLVFGSYEGVAGVYVFTVLDAPAYGGGRRFLYVNRGFAPQAYAAPEKRIDGEVRGELVIRGLFRAPEKLAGISEWLRPSGRSEEGLWFVRDPAQFAEAAGVETPAWYIDSNGAENPAPWPKGGTTRLEFRNRHLDYALTWFGLAAALFGVWVIFSLQKPD